MSKKYYAQLDENDYCCAMSDLKSDVNKDKMIKIKEKDFDYNNGFMGLKYDFKNQVFTKPALEDMPLRWKAYWERKDNIIVG